MATHPSILAWKIPRTVESMGSQRVRHDQATLAHSPMALSEKHRGTLSSGHMGHIWLACVSLVPESGIEPGPPAVKAPTSGPPENSQFLPLLVLCYPLLSGVPYVIT